MNFPLELTPALTGEDTRRFLMAIRNPKTLELRASKPGPNVGPIWNLDPGEVMYVWRMVAFAISTNPKHHCLPMCADFDVRIADYRERLARTRELDLIADAIVDTVPPSLWHGVARWSRAFGG
jgi:hypothetical protein